MKNQDNLDAFAQINASYGALTASQKKLADFVLSDPNFMITHSISEVSKACEVGEATISRFCRALGFNGYHDFKVAVVRCVSKEDEPVSSVSDSASNSPVMKSVKTVMTESVNALNRTGDMLIEKDIDRASELLVNARRIVFYGMGTSMAAAMVACNKFLRVTPKASIFMETHMQLVSASLLEEGDVAVVISRSGSTKEIVDIVRHAKARGAGVISITRYLQSPLTEYSDVLLQCGCNERVVYEYAISLEITQVLLIDILYTEFCRRMAESAQENKEVTAAALADKLY